MKAFRATGIIASALVSAALLTSPLALAGGKEDGPHGKRDNAGLCEKFQQGDREQKREQYRKKHDERHEAMADRLQLSDEQRQIWDEMRDERRQKYQRRLEKMKERCENRNQE